MICVCENCQKNVFHGYRWSKAELQDMFFNLHSCAVEYQNFLSNIMTGNESPIYICDPKIKQQSSQQKSPIILCSAATWHVSSYVKALVMAFFTA
jgi:hypothetical protein